MITYSLCLFFAVAAAQPPGHQRPSVTQNAKIVSVLHGKELIKAFIAAHPDVRYQNLARNDLDFPNSAIELPGQLKPLAIIRGNDAIAKFLAETEVPYTVPDNFMQDAMGTFAHVAAPILGRGPLPVAPGLGRGPQPAASGNGRSPQAQPPAPSHGRTPPSEHTYQEQLEAWNSGVRSTPPG